MRPFLLAACAAMAVAPLATAQGINTAADVVNVPPALYMPAAIAGIVGSIGMTFTNMGVLQPRMSEETKGYVGLGVGFFSLILGHAGFNGGFAGNETLPRINVIVGAMSVVTGVATLIRAGNLETTEAALVAPWLDSGGRRGVRIHLAF